MSDHSEDEETDESSSLLPKRKDQRNSVEDRKSPYSNYSSLPDAKQLSSATDVNNEYERVPEDDTSSTPTSETTGFSFFALHRKQKAILCSICMADFLSYLCLSLLAPFFPQEASSKGVNDTISGWIFGVFALSQVVFSPFFGKMLPYVGIKFMFLSGLFLSGGCTLLFGAMAYVPVDDGPLTFVVLCFLLRVFLSVGCTALNTACYTVCAKEFPDHIATVFGIGEVFVGVGFMSGPAIGGVLYGLGGFFTPFLVIGVLIIICVPVNWIILPPDDRFEQSESSTSSLTLLKSPSIIVASLAIIVASFIWSILDPTLEPHLREFDLGPELIGVLFLVMSAFYAISSPIWGWVADRCPDNRLLMIPGFLFSAVGMALLGPSTLIGFEEDYNVLWLNILALIILGIAASLALIPTFDIYLYIAEDLGFEDDMNTYSLVAGLFGSMYAFGDFLHYYCFCLSWNGKVW
ncbi:MFS-type transporter SLC18B1-like [Saccostrea cucullata]|uniref:MFS-type transporter SLC18B1-like n=1 Tax=Saccostrea cuccullata TaxID=36930 RepID=UPI002ED448C7